LRYISKKSASIASFNINNSLFNVTNNLKTVIDVGANVGQFAIATKQFYPNAVVHSFEPVPESFEKLQKNTAKHNDIYTYNCALGAEQSEIVFYKNEHSHASSALKVSDFQKENIPETIHFTEIKVKCIELGKLDFKKPLEKPILLKLDVQGYEKNVLDGSSNLLKKIDYLLLEVSFIQMYDNEPLFDEIHSYLVQKNFQLVSPIGALEMKNGSIAQLDMLYKYNGTKK
jgi:FkbM family methyltransferase